jgi:hypothetical protein
VATNSVATIAVMTSRVPTSGATTGLVTASSVVVVICVTLGQISPPRLAELAFGSDVPTRTR